MSGRLQLMLYHRLLGQLIVPPNSEGAFDFSQLFSHLRLNPQIQFSDDFIAEASQLLNGWDALASSSASSNDLVRCLDDLVQCWYETVQSLSLQPDAPIPNPGGPIDPTLELVYRSRATRKKKEKSKGKGKAKPRPVLLEEDPFVVSPGTHWTEQPKGLTEEEQIQIAIAESLKVQIGANGESSNIPAAPPSPPNLNGSTSDESGSASPVAEQEIEVLEQDAGVVASQNSQMEWERAFGDTAVGIGSEEVVSVGMPSVVGRDGPPEDSQRSGSAMVIDGDSQKMQAVEVILQGMSSCSRNPLVHLLTLCAGFRPTNNDRRRSIRPHTCPRKLSCQRRT